MYCQEPSVTQELFRDAMSRFASGVVAITASSFGKPVGLTVQSFASLSLDPLLIMFAVANSSQSWPKVATSSGFGVSILAAEQEWIARGLGKSHADKFLGIEWSQGKLTGAPLIKGSLGWLEASIAKTYPGGDHIIVTAEVLNIQVGSDGLAPLLFFQSQFRELRISNEYV